MSEITVAMPTYNRPSGLTTALNSVLSQTFTNFTILVSDNASTDQNVSDVIESFVKKDNRVRSFRQENNIGPCQNFIYLSKQAESQYLIFLADDDVWPPHHLERLVSCMNEQTVMVFPDTDLVSSNPERTKCNALKKTYEKCITDFDYLEAWCTDGSGQPFYGLYNLPKMKSCGLEFEFMEDIKYFNEGLFLHKLFLTGSVRFAPQTSIRYKTDGEKGSKSDLANAFLTYTERVVRLYLQAGQIPGGNRDELMQHLIKRYMQYLMTLCSDGKTRLPIRRRLSAAARILASGR